MASKRNTESPSRHRGAIELPSSPVWGYALLAIMALFVVVGIALIFGASADAISMPGGCIGIVHIDGEILADDVPDSLFSMGQSGSQEISELIEKADGRSDVKAILLQINSPGGSVVGSREIYMTVRETEKPIVAYFREIAASGGYYVGAGADYIVSEPDALTGSIGARMTLSQMSGLFGMVGYNETTFKSGEFKDIGNPSREISEGEKEILQSIIDEAYLGFETDVIAGRGKKLNMQLFYENVTDARILTGRQAYKIGLVDEIGSKKDAIAKASQMAGFDEPLEVCEIKEKETSFFGQLFSGAFDITPLLGGEKTGIEYR